MAKFNWVGDGTIRMTTGNETIKVYSSAGTKKVTVKVTATDARPAPPPGATGGLCGRPMRLADVS